MAVWFTTPTNLWPHFSAFVLCRLEVITRCNFLDKKFQSEVATKKYRVENVKRFVLEILPLKKLHGRSLNTEE